jgi:hypothetical protein
LNRKCTGSIKFCSFPVVGSMMGMPLDKSSIREVDICEHFGVSTPRTVVKRLHLDPKNFDKAPLNAECVANNPHWMQLKDALEAAAHASGSPIMCNGGGSGRRTFKCKLHNRLHRPKLSTKKGGAPRQDHCINMDKGGRRPRGSSELKRTHPCPQWTCLMHPFHLSVKNGPRLSMLT